MLALCAAVLGRAHTMSCCIDEWLQAFRKQTFNLLDELRAAGADCSQVDQDELDKWQMM